MAQAPGSAQGRDIGLDVTRILAFVAVPCTHFFLRTDFYATDIAGSRMYVMTAMRTLFMICVPLFLLLTGYLSSEKTTDLEPRPLLRYYRRLVPILLTYALSTLLVVLAVEEGPSLRDIFFNILDYRQYSWYINMYIGLALMIPFLNVLWHGLKTRRQQAALVVIFLVLTALPSVVNVYDLDTPGAWRQPWRTTTYTQIVPDWWQDFFPVTYYFLGAYLRENVDMKALSTWRLALALLLTVTGFTLYNIWRSGGGTFVSGTWSDSGGVQNIVDAVLVFLLVNSIRYPGRSAAVRKVLAYLSRITLGAYLLTWIPDSRFYPRFDAAVPEPWMRLNYFPLMVGLTVVVSLALAAVVQTVVQLLMKLGRIGKKEPDVRA